jgi:hypothetical protein
VALVTILSERIRMREVTCAVGWGGTVDHPEWRVDVSTFEMGDSRIVSVEVWEGYGPSITEEMADEVVGQIQRQVWSMLRDEFQVLCIDHEVIGCVDCFGDRRAGLRVV